MLSVLTWYAIDCPQWTQHSYRSYRRQVQIFHIRYVFQETSNNYKEIQSIPRISHIGIFAMQAHRYSFDQHFDGEENENDVVEDLEIEDNNLAVILIRKNCFIGF